MKKKSIALIAAFAIVSGASANNALTPAENHQAPFLSEKTPGDPEIKHVVLYDDSGLKILVVDHDKIEETIGQNPIYKTGVTYYFKIKDEQGEIKDGKYLKE